jgi:hypothetical protein
MFGVARLNTLAKYQEPTGKSFGSVVLGVSTTSGNQISPRGLQYMGFRNSVYFFASARALGSTNGTVDLVKFTGSSITVSSYNNTVSSLPYTSEVATNINSTAIGGQVVAGWHDTATGAGLVRFLPGYVTDWATTPTTASTLTNGTAFTATGDTTLTQFHLAMANSQRLANPGVIRPGWFYKSSASTISFRNATIPSVSNTVTLRAGLTSIVTGLTSATGNFLSACGFDTDSDTNYAYALGWVGGTSSIYSMKVVSVNTTTVRQATTIDLSAGAAITLANIDAVRNTYGATTTTDSIFIACITTATNTRLEAIRITNWNSFTAVATSSYVDSWNFGALKDQARFVAVKGKEGSGYVISRATSTTFEAQEIAVAAAGTISLVGSPYTLTTTTASTAFPFSAEAIFDGTNEIIGIQYSTTGSAQRTGFWKTV